VAGTEIAGVIANQDDDDNDAMPGVCRSGKNDSVDYDNDAMPGCLMKKTFRLGLRTTNAPPFRLLYVTRCYTTHVTTGKTIHSPVSGSKGG
jgi:hypothetical protein